MILEELRIIRRALDCCAHKEGIEARKLIENEIYFKTHNIVTGEEIKKDDTKSENRNNESRDDDRAASKRN